MRWHTLVAILFLPEPLWAQYGVGVAAGSIFLGVPFAEEEGESTVRRYIEGSMQYRLNRHKALDASVQFGSYLYGGRVHLRLFPESGFSVLGGLNVFGVRSNTTGRWDASLAWYAGGELSLPLGTRTKLIFGGDFGSLQHFRDTGASAFFNGRMGIMRQWDP